MTPPFTLAHYSITSKLGEGGMGAVYRATDTKLNREVAIKVLPEAFTNDPGYLARFIREAQVLASLNHPNIAILHGVEENALVMELVPGQTLEERIAAGPIPLDEALGIARQICEALEAAHEKGVIHRDLKPANVKVTPEGVVKVLDFGLAKAADPVVSAATANSQTLTIRATQAGMILGTAGYMAPEQAAGKPVDRRADIWSFGVVLYELLTGTVLFQGETISHTLASVLKDRIDFAIPQAPPPIRSLLARCLNRDPKERLRDIGEARIAIRNYLANPPADAEEKTAGVSSAMPTRSGGVSGWLPWIISAALSAALAAAAVWIFRPSPHPQVTRFAVQLGQGQELNSRTRLALAISPDGTHMVYAANRRLYLRSMSDEEARPIAGTESPGRGVANAAFSPDGKWLAYLDVSAETIKRISVSGGSPLTICSGTNLSSLSWDDEGILFSALDKGILRVAPSGGQPQVLIAAKEDEMLLYPQMLPGGRSVLFSQVLNTSLAGAQDTRQISVQDLKSGVRKVVVADAASPAYLPTGHLVYFRNGILFAVPFHPGRLEAIGNEVGIIEGVLRLGNTAQFAFSNAGSLIYLPGPISAAGTVQSVLAQVDRQGEVTPLAVPPGGYGFPRVSKDGKRVAYQNDDGKELSIWIWELAGGSAPRRLTLPGAGSNRFPIWSPDNQRVAFQSDREGDFAIWWQRADGNGVAERLTRPAGKDVAHVPDSWSPDGQTLSLTERKGNDFEVWTYSLKDRNATRFAADTAAPPSRSMFSPDGRWVVYQTATRRRSRIYVRPFPPTSTAYLMPEDDDSHHPVWSPDGKELFYIPGPGQLGSVSISLQPVLSFGTPVRAPKAGFTTQPPAGVRSFDILPDGKHFIGLVPPAQAGGTPDAPQIHVVLNWFEDVKQRSPAN